MFIPGTGAGYRELKDRYVKPSDTYAPVGPTLITSHGNADFDAIGAMLAAQKLYPDSRVVLPDSSGNNLKDLYLNSVIHLFNLATAKSLDLAAVKRLVLVDTRQKNRIGPLKELLSAPDVSIHIYDHHPRTDNDIRGDLDHYERTGSTTTILTGIIREMGIELSPEEATVLALGIYEDTGSFTFNSTTEADFSAAAFLLGKGADLNTVAGMLKVEITPRQVGLLNDMIQGAERHHVGGIDILMASISTEKYVREFSSLVHLMVKMENPAVIFACARMGSKIFVSARSRIDAVDVGEVLRLLGGGGHAYAAAATISDMTLVQTEQFIIEALHEKIRPRRRASDLMSSPAITIPHTASCITARNHLTRYNINALLVIEETREKRVLTGIISRQVIEKALYHKLDHIPVSEYMSTEVVSAAPSADLVEIQEKIIDFKQRVLPVMEGEAILGVITRTDLFNTLVKKKKEIVNGAPDPFTGSLTARKRNIINLMRERLDKGIIHLLDEIGRVAEGLHFGCYVVGGFVRDLLLYKDNDDIDIVIEGDGIAFAKRYAKMMNARLHTYEKFGTAVITLPDGFKIDVASARMEYYKYPAALPIVEMSSIKLDLFRRDFTINTLAVKLNPGSFGTLIDFFSARNDLKDKAVRIIHNLSFVEDPTRAFRAVKFEKRYGFTIGKLTANLIRNAVKRDFFKRLSGLRVLAELRQILEEENPVPAVERLFDFDLMQIVHPRLKFDKNMIAGLESVRKVLSWHDLLFVDTPFERWPIYFMAIIKGSNRTTTQDICARLKLAPRYVNLFTKQRFRAGGVLFRMERNIPVRNSTIYRHLNDLKPELLLYMMAVTRKEAVKKAISLYYTQLSSVTISIMGRDLQELGLKPSPAYRKILDSVLHAKLDGRIESPEEELAHAKMQIKKLKAAGN